MNGPNSNLTPWVTEKFISAAPSAAAKALGALATHEAVLLLKPLKAESLIACLNPMEPAKAAAILRRLPARQGAHVLARLDVPQAAKVFALFSVPQQEKMKTMLPARLVTMWQQTSAWKEGSAGAKMSADFVAFKTEVNLTEIIEKLKILPRKKLPEACLVTDKNGKLKGFIRTAELAFYASVSTAGSVMNDAASLTPQERAEKAQRIFEQAQPVAPVVDKEGVLLGVLSVKDLARKESSPRKKRFFWF